MHSVGDLVPPLLVEIGDYCGVVRFDEHSLALEVFGEGLAGPNHPLQL